MIPDEGIIWALKVAVGIAPQEHLVVRLFTNGKRPSRSDGADDYIEAQGGGYVAPVLAKGWTADYTERQLTRPEHTWVFSGQVGAVYGWYMTTQKSNTLIWAERFPDGPYDIQNKGDRIALPIAIAWGE